MLCLLCVHAKLICLVSVRSVHFMHLDDLLLISTIGLYVHLLHLLHFDIAF